MSKTIKLIGLTFMDTDNPNDKWITVQTHYGSEGDLRFYPSRFPGTRDMFFYEVVDNMQIIDDGKAVSFGYPPRIFSSEDILDFISKHYRDSENQVKRNSDKYKSEFFSGLHYPGPHDMVEDLPESDMDMEASDRAFDSPAVQEAILRSQRNRSGIKLDNSKPEDSKD